MKVLRLFALLVLVTGVAVMPAPKAGACSHIFCAQSSDQSLCTPDDFGCEQWCSSGDGAAQCGNADPNYSCWFISGAWRCKCYLVIC
jgi:hypothetical protein